MPEKHIVIENQYFRLTIGTDAVAKSLVYLPTNEECITPDTTVPLFSVTQERPFNNEVKLAHPNTRTTFPANRVRMEEGKLIVGFAITPFEAIVDVKVAERYFAFQLVDFIVHPTDYPCLSMTPPPVSAFRLIQLPVIKRKNFGAWMNVNRDENVAVAVMAISPQACIASEERMDCRIMTADAIREQGLRGTTAALIVACPADFMDAVDTLEADYDLPRGVAARRSPYINRSIYWTFDLNPANADEHIRRAKQGGFSLMVLSYTCFFKEDGYYYNSDYDFNDNYPNGKQDVLAVLKKVNDAGIQPGFHVLQTHVGLRSRYVTPVADHRLLLTKHFTLAQPLSETDTVITVEENPRETVMANGCRVLAFGGELITYTSYSTERPYRFLGCERGYCKTNVKSHPMGEIGGILAISEYGAMSVYLDQNASLADEVADKIADVFNLGFRFIYFDGSEGTNEPYGYHVPGSQYRVWQCLSPAPLFAEGAAKAHFGWHLLSGGNAFDVFGPAVFKEKIKQYPAEEAPRMRMDFTRINFGFWGYWAPSAENNGIQPDMWEYGTSRAAAWDCPISVQTNLDLMNRHPRTDDNLEVVRRWEDVREKNLLTEDQKQMLRDLTTEHHLLINEKGEYELVAYRQIPCGVKDVRCFLFSRQNKTYVLYWHETSANDILLPFAGDAVVCRNLGIDATVFEGTLHAQGRQYFVTDAAEDEVLKAFADAKTEAIS